VRAPVPPGRWPAGPAFPPGQTLPEVWSARWSAHPTAPVLLDGWDHTRVVDGAALDATTARVAGALASAGVVAGDRVLWSARGTLESIQVLLGILRSGAVLVTVSPSATAAEVEHFVADCAPALVVTDDAKDTADVAPGRVPPGVRVLSVDALLERAASAPLGANENDLAHLRPGADALIVYTSGTTGRPKGAVHTHASLLAAVGALVQAWGWQTDDRLLLALPLFHVHGLAAGLFGTLAAGASAVVFDRFDEEAIVSAAGAEAATMFFGVPTMYHRLAASGRAGGLAALRLCVCGSAPLAAELWHDLSRNGVEVLERYGMTETLLTLSNPLQGERRPGAVGRPLPGVEAALEGVDEDGVGELLVRGDPLCRGYWNRSDPFIDAEGWFATGDLASVADDGYVAIRGRRTELIITGGHNVYPAEVEAVLARHPDVDEVAVVGLPSAEWGETVVAFVVGSPDLAELHALAAAELAPFKRPRDLRLVDALPRNALGKVVRKDLR
jgi:malonyl-CoA/methylmalonyl-CoA synthetase